LSSLIVSLTGPLIETKDKAKSLEDTSNLESPLSRLNGLIRPLKAKALLAFPIISPSLHAPLGLGLRGEQERERR